MLTVGIIPARMNSSRFPGKPLEKICGMPMIGHCYFRTSIALGPENTYVATCDNEIASYINSIGGKVIMTNVNHTRATTRTSEAQNIIEKKLGKKIDIVIMVQGDEPLILPKTISKMVSKFKDQSVNIANIMSTILTKESFEDVNNVKVVVDKDSNALYFSREPIPSPWNGWRDIPKFLQTGIIAFRGEVLAAFNSLEETSLEKVESVDMNRVLETGGSIKMVHTSSNTLGVDTVEELRFAEKLIESDDTTKQYL
jgi:3-deoxy-manno-octulosonate cytidylyltransferase (CMP-KDO synthetase)